MIAARGCGLGHCQKSEVDCLTVAELYRQFTFDHRIPNRGKSR